MRIHTFSDFYGWLERQREWSLRTFGDGLRTVGITKHIEKECAEIRAHPTDLKEWLDIFTLSLDGYRRAGGTIEGLMPLLQAQQDRNFARSWGPILPEHLPMEHVRCDMEELRKQDEADRFAALSGTLFSS